MPHNLELFRWECVLHGTSDKMKWYVCCGNDSCEIHVAHRQPVGSLTFWARIGLQKVFETVCLNGADFYHLPKGGCSLEIEKLFRASLCSVPLLSGTNFFIFYQKSAKGWLLITSLRLSVNTQRLLLIFQKLLG